MQIKRNLYSIDNKLLIKAGEKINEGVLNRIAQKTKNIRYVKLKNTMLIKDVERIFKDKRYKNIFSPSNINEKVLNITKQVSMPEKILSELKVMKRKLPYTYHHVLIITALSTKMALDECMKKVYDAKKTVQLGLLHDIGKSRILSKILNKRTPLTRMERKILKQHPFIGYMLLHYYYGRNHHKYDYASYEHHERLDGSGYPRRIKRINRYAQLIAVVDVLDALLSSRPYRKAPYTLRSTIDYLLDEAKKGRLNKKIVYLLISYARKDKPKFFRLKIANKKRDIAPVKNVYGKTASK